MRSPTCSRAATLRRSDPRPCAAEQAGRTGTVVVADGLRSRGGETPTNASGLLVDRDLRSLASATPLSADELVKVTARLHSTLVSYWVAPDATYVWVVRPSGEITGQRIAVTERRLTELVRQTWMTGDASLRGEAASDQVATSEPSVAADNLQADEAWTPRLRGDGLLSFGETPVVALGALHKLLVAPIQRLLPTERGSLLTILPHGPLFRLSFAALRNPSGQYSSSGMRFTTSLLASSWISRTRARVRGKRSTVSADCRPSDFTALPGGAAAPPPGTRGKSASRGARAASAATSLVGAGIQSLGCVRWPDRSVLHRTRGNSRRRSLESFAARHRAHGHQSDCPAIWFVGRSRRRTVDGS